ncbi:hypothetical protein HA402_006153 [Bradysia odoriphaga]|nr:hypothetical protein HA402_006153 [Bradysia odoriphaga]
MDVCDGSSSFNGNTTSSDINKTIPNDSVILVHSDDEDFAGFGDCKNEQQSFKPLKIKEEPTSDTEAADLGGFNVKLEVKTEVIDEPHQNSSRQAFPLTPAAQQKRVPCDINDDRFKIPFKFGWKRELVYRSQMADTRTKSDKAEVYYITPEGKKLRTKSEIQSCLTDGLDLNMFTFAKDPLGVGLDYEIVRSAKSYSQQTQRKVPVQNFLDLGEADPSLGFGKRVPKPKMPKGASPPPTNRNAIPAGSNARKASEPPADVDSKNVKTLKSSSKLKSNQNSSNAALTTGEDGSPPAKKRMLSRSSSKAQTPVSSPTHSPGASAGLNFGGDASKIKRNNINSVEPLSHTLLASNFMSNAAIGYKVLLDTFQYLKVQELLRASCVCRLWNQAASNSKLWRTVRMKNSQVNDWSGLANTLQRNQTKHLDLRKMLVASDTEQTWQQFASNIGKVANLETIDLCRCSASVVIGLFESNPSLRVLNAVAIKTDSLDLDNLNRLSELRELRLRSLNTMTLSNLKSLEGLAQLTHLSLTSATLSETDSLNVIGKLVNLESLELGECPKLSGSFAESLKCLQKLEKLRLEKGTDHCCTFDILDALATLPKLTQLELVNFDIKPHFDDHLSKCRTIKRLLIIPTYISQSATTNNVILSGILCLKEHLEQLTWVVTLELLRVTELYVDQCDVSPRDRRQAEDKIPVLKPVPGLSEEDQQNESNSDVPQVEILSLSKVENILSQHLPTLRYSILKVPYSATWRQTMSDM